MNKQLWIDQALAKGMDGLEIYESHSRSKEATWFEGKMDSFVTSNTYGISVRAIVEGKAAYLALESDNDEQMEEVLNHLLEQAKTITSKEKTVLTSPQETEIVKNPHQWTDAPMPEVYKVMAEIEQKVLNYDPRVIQVGYLAWSEEFGSRAITNSKGLDVYDEEGFQAMICTAVVQEDGEVKDDTLIKIVPDLAALDVDAFVKELTEGALGKLHGTSLPSRKYPVILHRDAMTALFASFAGLFSGELINKGISPLAGRLHEKIFSDLITIIDNPRNTDALSIANFDDEGYPTCEKVIVDKGVFETILHSNKSAAKVNEESTGNGFKGGFAAPVSISPYNMCIVPGEKDLDALCQQMQEGLVITDLAGLHAGLDFVSTNFSLQCSGYYVKNGVKDHAVTLITVASSFMELMNQVVAVGSDLDWKYHSIAAPSILFKECSISGE